MKKQIVSMMVFAICAIFMETEVLAQGVAVYKKNGTVMKIPYEELDSIVTYNYGEDVKNGVVQGHECVDLGLSVKWATCNVGANTPEDYGDYYAWGETSTKSDYTWETYKWCEGTKNSMTKYCEWSSDGNVDKKYTLDKSDDAAYVKWGDKWRMPTRMEIEELFKYCTWTLTTRGDIYGYEITGSNGNSIFMPAAGKCYDTTYTERGTVTADGYYWSANLSGGVSHKATCIFSDIKDFSSEYRYLGLPIRPVTE